MDDRIRFMKLALSLAKKADPFPNPRVGAVLVKGGKIIGMGYHCRAGLPHAEIEAIEDAKLKTRNQHAARGATLYVTLEPCSHTMKRTPPCTKAIIAHGLKRVVYAMRDPNPLVSGAKELKRAGIQVSGPGGEKEAMALNKRYIANIARQPFVAMKMAMSADGKTATRTGDSRWISGAKARDFVHRMRSGFDAVMVGAGTIKTDDPELTTHGKGRNPWRIIVDGRLSMPLDARLLKNMDGKTIVVISGKAEQAKALAIQRAGARVLVCGSGPVDLRKLVAALGAMGIKRILIEGGSELNAAAMAAGIVDRLYLFIAPKIIGGKDAKPVIGGRGIGKMGDAPRLEGMRMRRIGEDLLLEASIMKNRMIKRR
jgi:diaminohydroxyphosphoribosylaminopyrimidine deaminase/5-amino-6-(5-phosphoribosylamino)uracil reductase